MIFICFSLILFILLIKYSYLKHWLLIYFITDPGGYLNVYLNKGSLFGGLYFTDLLIIGVFYFFIIGGYKFQTFFEDKFAKGIFYSLLLFASYKIIIYGWVVPETNLSEFLRFFILRERWTIFGFIILIPVYTLALRNLESLLKIIIVLGTIIIILVLISSVTGLELAPIRQGVRYAGDSTSRLYLYSRGFLVLLIPISFIVYLSKVNVKYRTLLYVGGLLSIISILVTLTKGVYISTTVTIIACVHFVSKILKINKANNRIRSFGLIMGVVFVFSIFFPRYVDYSLRSFQDIFLIASTGLKSDGAKETRLNQIPATIYMLNKHPFFGTGYKGYENNNLSKKYRESQFDSSDFSLVVHLMYFGAVGISLYLFFYYRVYYISRFILQKIKTIKRSSLLNKYKYEFIFAIVTVSILAGYLARLHNIFYELSNGELFLQYNIIVGILLAVIRRVRLKQKIKFTTQL